MLSRRLLCVFLPRSVAMSPDGLQLQGIGGGSRALRRSFLPRRALSLSNVPLGLSCWCRCSTFSRRRQANSSPPRLRQTDRDGLLGRPRAVLAFADVVHLLLHELAGLRAGRFSLRSVFASSFQGLFLRPCSSSPVGCKAIRVVAGQLYEDAIFQRCGWRWLRRGRIWCTKKRVGTASLTTQ